MLASVMLIRERRFTTSVLRGGVLIVVGLAGGP